MQIIFALVALFCLVEADLLDLYVQHMDETMNPSYGQNLPTKHHRPRRSIKGPFRLGTFRKQRLDVDESFWFETPTSKKPFRVVIPYTDGLAHPNLNEKNLQSKDFEIFREKEKIQTEEGFSTSLNSLRNQSRVPKKFPSMDSLDKPKRLMKEERSADVLGISDDLEDLGSQEMKSGVPKKFYRTNEVEKASESTKQNFSAGLSSISVNSEDLEPLEIVNKALENKSRVPKRFQPTGDIKRLKRSTGESEYQQLMKKKRSADFLGSAIDSESLEPFEKKTRVPKKVRPTNDLANPRKSMKHKRSLVSFNFTRREILDDLGHVILEWDPSDEVNVTFRVTARTRGYVGIGFNDKNHMMGADILVAWVDDHDNKVNLLDSHGLLEANGSPITDQSQDVEILSGSQNGTHTVITFRRNWQTCDPEDRHLNEDNVRVLWALGESDPELNTPAGHGDRRGGRALRLRGAMPKPSPPRNPDIRHWDVKLNQYAVDDKQDTIYWCKIFKAPAFNKKHHMIGYEPLVEKSNENLVHHMILYECASTSPGLGKFSRISGNYCYDSTMPPEWESCIQPIVAWGRGSKGEWFADHVGIPVGEHREGSYYMLEVHYNNPSLKKAIDSSGIRLHLTPHLRQNEAGIFVAGVAVSPLHFVPPRQREYATAGYCCPDCTNKLFPEDGVNVISVVLHSHLAGRRMSLKHIRSGEELPHIVRENRFDFDYQQSHGLDEEVKVLPGDELVTECVYDTHNRENATLGGYAAYQEMCLSFVVYYPRTELAGCYSMTPATDLFKTLGVTNFKGVSLDNLEKLFLTAGVETVTLPTIVQQQLPVYPPARPLEDIDDKAIKERERAIKALKEFTEQVTDDNVFARLVIEDPEEFRGRTLAEHMSMLAWSDSLLTKPIEDQLYHGRHMTFCRRRDDKLAIPADILMFPNFTKLPEPNQTVCSEKKIKSSSKSSAPNFQILALIFILGLYFC